MEEKVKGGECETMEKEGKVTKRKKRCIMSEGEGMKSFRGEIG